MIKYYCKECKIECESSSCAICGERTITKSKIYWCENCNVPIYEEVCSCCGGNGKEIGTDIRPVFPEERLMLEILLGEPFKYKDSSVWVASNNKYIIDGVKKRFKQSKLMEMSPSEVIEQLEKNKAQNSYEVFEKYISKFIKINSNRYNFLVTEAVDFIKEQKKNYSDDETFVSFSGGKDSTVVSSLVMRALGNPSIIHIFGDTTLEFPFTYEYAKRFKSEHTKTPFLSARNKDMN